MLNCKGCTCSLKLFASAPPNAFFVKFFEGELQIKFPQEEIFLIKLASALYRIKYDIQEGKYNHCAMPRDMLMNFNLSVIIKMSKIMVMPCN